MFFVFYCCILSTGATAPSVCQTTLTHKIAPNQATGATCQLRPGIGCHNVFLFDSNGVSSTSSVQVCYVAVPVLSGVTATGCMNPGTSANGMSACPTAGGVTVTLFGTGFGSSGATSTACTGPVTHDPSQPDAKLTCTLAAGAPGSSFQPLVTTSGKTTVPSVVISYGSYHW